MANKEYEHFDPQKLKKRTWLIGIAYLTSSFTFLCGYFLLDEWHYLLLAGLFLCLVPAVVLDTPIKRNTSSAVVSSWFVTLASASPLLSLNVAYFIIAILAQMFVLFVCVCVLYRPWSLIAQWRRQKKREKKRKIRMQRKLRA